MMVKAHFCRPENDDEKSDGTLILYVGGFLKDFGMKSCQMRLVYRLPAKHGAEFSSAICCLVKCTTGSAKNHWSEHWNI